MIGKQATLLSMVLECCSNCIHWRILDHAPDLCIVDGGESFSCQK